MEDGGASSHVTVAVAMPMLVAVATMGVRYVIEQGENRRVEKEATGGHQDEGDAVDDGDPLTK